MLIPPVYSTYALLQNHAFHPLRCNKLSTGKLGVHYIHANVDIWHTRRLEYLRLKPFGRHSYRTHVILPRPSRVGCSFIILKLGILHLSVSGTLFYNRNERAQWLSGRVLDSRPKGRGFEPHRRHCVVVLEQDTFSLA